MNALGLGLLAALCWGIHDVTVRRISQSAPLMATLLWVLIIGAVFQVIAMAGSGGFAPVTGSALGYSALAGVAFTLAGAALYGAFHRGPVRIVAPVIGSYPILSVGLASLTGSAITPLQWLAVLAVVGGIAVVAVFAHETEQETPPIGPTIALSAFAAAGFFATFALGQEAARLAEDMPSILITRLVAIAVLLPVMLVMGLPLLPGRGALVFVCIMGLLDCIALISVLSAGDMPSAEYAAVASSTFGMITIILARVFLSEGMTWVQWAGCALTFAGIGYLAL